MNQPYRYLSCAALFALGTAAFYQGLAVRNYQIGTPKWKQGGSARLAVVSDLHGTWFGKGQSSILRLLKEQRPDHILLPGDIVDEIHPEGGSLCFLKNVAQIAPTWYALGNHEYRTHKVPEIRAVIRRFGISLLLDSYIRMDTPAGPLVLAGCEDPEKKLRQDPNYCAPAAWLDAFREIRANEAYTVLLAHRPEHYRRYQRLGFDLTVSGHAHGGQFRIPYVLNGTFAPGQGFFPAHAGGCYRCGTMRHIVGRGTNIYPQLPRIFNPPEIVTIDITGQK